MDLGNDGGAGAGGEGGAAGGASSADLLGVAAGAGQAGEGAGAAGGDGAAGAGAVDGGAAGAGGDIAGGADPDWYNQLSAEKGENDSPANRDVVKAKGWKSLDDMVKGYREAERALRDSGRVKVPGEGASDEEVNAFRAAIGVPDKVEGYEFKPLVDEKGEPFVGSDGSQLQLDKELLGTIAASAMKHGVPKGALEGVIADMAQAQLAEVSAKETAIAAEAERVVKGWGGEKDAKIAAMDRALKALDISSVEAKAIRAALGAEKALTTFARLGEGMSEDRMMLGGQTNFGISGPQAQAQFDQLSKDPAWVSKARVPGTAENAQYKRLNAAMGQEADRQAAAAGTA